MTLGRVYVPPNRTGPSQLMATSLTPSNRSYKTSNSYNNNFGYSSNNNFNNNNNNNNLVNGYSNSNTSQSNGFRTIEIKVLKKDESNQPKTEKELITSNEEHSDDVPTTTTITNGIAKSPLQEEEEDVEWEPDNTEVPSAPVQQLPRQLSQLEETEGNEPKIIPIEISVDPNWSSTSNENSSQKNEDEEQTVIPSRWKEYEEEEKSKPEEPAEDEPDDSRQISNGDISSWKTGFSLPANAKGLKNLGNTCFMNSIIQCLANTKSLLDFCQSYESTDKAGSYLGQIATTARDPKITRAFVKLILDMWKGGTGVGGSNHGVADPSSFRREMTIFAPKFGGYDQHDSQEFLQYFLEGLHTEMNRAEQPNPKKKTESKPKESENNGNCDGQNEENGSDQNHKPSESDSDSENGNGETKVIDPNDAEAPGISAEEKGRRSWRQYLKRDNSFITDLFLGQFRSTLKCSDCGHESVTFEPFWVVSAPINAKTSKDIMDCLELFVTEETLDGDEKPTCESCKTKQKCTKWYSFERWPKILVIHLKRFAPAGSYRGKLSSLITTPLQNLDLSTFSSCKLKQSGGLTNGYSSSQYNVIYDCYGISNHSGSLSGGHYTAYCRHPEKTQNWHLYNDRSVSGANPDHVVTGEAYLLFFERKFLSNDEY